MGVPVFRHVSEGELREWRARRGGARGVASFEAPPRPADRQGEPLPRFVPQGPRAVFDGVVDHLWRWSKASKEDWLVSVAAFRRQNPTATAHMTDEQLYGLLRGKAEDAVKRAFRGSGRGRELQIKVGGF